MAKRRTAHSSIVTPFNPRKAEEDLRRYCESIGEDLDELLKEAAKALPDELPTKMRTPTKEEIDDWVDFILDD